MKLMKRDRNRWSVAFTLVFAVQILVSSLCISTTAQAMETASSEHCQQNMEQVNMHHEMGSQPMHEMSMSTCSHCASPEDFTLFASSLDVSPADLLLAFVVVETPATTSATTLLNFMERAYAPPRSSTTLYNTTQRIRI
ncbi:MAG: hypothetical protein GQ467_02250 [Mariprofundaceae bacterium]|nr:hypothetical protein [Mariprofundaceae bacterium]